MINNKASYTNIMCCCTTSYKFNNRYIQLDYTYESNKK